MEGKRENRGVKRGMLEMSAKPSPPTWSTLQNRVYTRLAALCATARLPEPSNMEHVTNVFIDHVSKLCGIPRKAVQKVFALDWSKPDLGVMAHAMYSLAKLVEVCETCDVTGQVDEPMAKQLTDEIFMNNPRLVHNSDVLLEEFVRFLNGGDFDGAYLKRRKCQPIIEQLLRDGRDWIDAYVDQRIEERRLEGEPVDSLSAEELLGYEITARQCFLQRELMHRHAETLQLMRDAFPSPATSVNVYGTQGEA